MPKSWLYIIAVILPVFLNILTVTPVMNAFWYHGYEQYYYALATLQANPVYNTYFSGWPLVVFCITAICYWMIDTNHYGSMREQFLLLPLFYVPFSIIGHTMVTWEFRAEALYTHPLVIIPIGYMYVLLWTALVATFGRLRLVI